MKNAESIKIRCSPEFKKKLSEIAESGNMDMSSVIRLACNPLIDQYQRDGRVTFEVRKSPDFQAPVMA